MSSTLTIGVIGHVDHGKTALVRALTGIDTDRLPEEKARGISIALGFAHLDVAGGALDLIDMPGHERFVRTMVAGATGIRAVLLAVAADEAIKPQTLEHAEIARLIGVRHGVVAVTKCDLVPPARAAEVGALGRRLLSAAGIAAAPAVATSAATGAGLDDLGRALGDLRLSVRPVEDHGFAYLPIDRVFSVAGFGTVVTGTLRRGRLMLGDALEVLPGGGRVRVRGLQAHGVPLDEVGPGRRVAVNLRRLEGAALGPGQSLATPGVLKPSLWLDAAISLSPEAPALPTGAELHLLGGTAEVLARLRLLDRERLEPGDQALGQLKLVQPLALPAREPVILRSGAPLRTVGGGSVLDPAAWRRRRGDRSVLDRLGRLAEAGPAEAVEAALAEAGPAGLTLDRLVQLAGHSRARVESWLAALDAVRLGPRLALARAAYDALVGRLLARLDEFHRTRPLEPGMDMAALSEALAVPGPTIEALVAGERLLVRDGGKVRRRSFAPASVLEGGDRAAAEAVESAYRAGGLTPPDRDRVVEADDRRLKALHLLVREGVLVRAVDRVQRRELYFHRSAVEAARQAIATGLSDGFLVREAGALLGISRKYSVPLLEHLDRSGFTRRQGDRRFVTAPPPTRRECR